MKEGIGIVFDENYFARRDELKETCKAVYDGTKEDGVYEILGHFYLIHKTGTYSQMNDKGK
jgi:hypothetical protein